jgi:hypothetical protein
LSGRSKSDNPPLDQSDFACRTKYNFFDIVQTYAIELFKQLAIHLQTNNATLAMQIYLCKLYLHYKSA